MTLEDIALALQKASREICDPADDAIIDALACILDYLREHRPEA